MNQTLPVLYSFRRCPYAIRARLAIASAGVSVALREVVLKDKPEAMLQASPKGTVPVLVLTDGTVIDESWDVMDWALAKNDPDGLLRPELSEQSHSLWQLNDFQFKPCLDRYKYADRHPEKSMEEYRAEAEQFLHHYEGLLQNNRFLLTEQPSLIDLAIFPFVRQFAFVDKAWFDQSPYPKLQQWLNYWLEQSLFQSVMSKYPQWQPGNPEQPFPE